MSTAVKRDLKFFRDRTRVTDTECWEWQLRTVKGPRGGAYGYTSRQGEQTPIAAHRLAYEVFTGPIPRGYEVDHTCENTVCCNPSHLEAVTPEENKRRTWLRGSGRNQNTSKTHCAKCGEPYSMESKRGDGRTFRSCRPCTQAYQREYYARRKGTWS